MSSGNSTVMVIYFPLGIVGSAIGLLAFTLAPLLAVAHDVIELGVGGKYIYKPFQEVRRSFPDTPGTTNPTPSFRRSPNVSNSRFPVVLLRAFFLDAPIASTLYRRRTGLVRQCSFLTNRLCRHCRHNTGPERIELLALDSGSIRVAGHLTTLPPHALVQSKSAEAVTCGREQIARRGSAF